MRAIRARRETSVDPLVSLALCWTGVFLAVFSFFPHQRPDLIYPAEPALALLAGGLVRREFPAWAPRALAALALTVAALLASGLLDRMLPPDVPRAVTWIAIVVLLAGSAAALLLRPKSAAVASCAVLAAIGLAKAVFDTLGDAPHNELVSCEGFARTALSLSSEQRTPIVAVGVDKASVLFDLGITAMPPADAAALAGTPRPVLVVTPRRLARDVVSQFGPAEEVASYSATDTKHPSFVLLALR